MPNWTKNELRITGNKVTLKEFKERAVDFGPNYKQTQLDKTVFGDKEPEKSILSFNAFLPVPEKLLKRSYGGEDESKKGTATPVDCCRSGYEWEGTHWGCKWGACDISVREESLDVNTRDVKQLEKMLGVDPTLIYEFDTAWAPPETFLQKVSEMYPNLTFVNKSLDEYDGYKMFTEVTYKKGIRSRPKHSKNPDYEGEEE